MDFYIKQIIAIGYGFLVFLSCGFLYRMNHSTQVGGGATRFLH